MIARIHRFHGHNSLRYVYQHGATIHESYSALKYIRNPRRTTYRAAVVVSRKVHKSAVQRNRIRRRIYEVVGMYEPRIREPYDLVFTVFSEQIKELTPKQLQTLVRAQLQKAGALTTPLRTPTDGSTHDIVKARKS